FPKRPTIKFGVDRPPPHNEPDPSVIHKFPPELLQTIFCEAIDSSEYYSSLFSIRSVCKYWKEVIDGTPTLWTVITSTLNRNLVAMALRNSGTQPLSVKYSSGSGENFKKFISLVATSAPRWRQLECNSKDRSEHEQMLSLSLLQLRSLNIVGAIGISYEQPLDAPELTTLSVWTVGLNWATLSGLHSLIIGNTAGPSMEELLKILKASLQLESLFLSATSSWFTAGYSDPSATPVILSRLNTMSCHKFEVQPLSYILDLIEAPNLQASNFTFSSASGMGDHTLDLRSVGRLIGAYRPVQDGTRIQVSVQLAFIRFRFAIGELGVEYIRTWWTEGNALETKLAHLGVLTEQMDPRLRQVVNVLAVEGDETGEIAKYLPMLHRRFPQIEELAVKEVGTEATDSRMICGQLSRPSLFGEAREWLFPNLTRLRFNHPMNVPYDCILPLIDVRRAEETRTITELRLTGGTISPKMANALQDSVQVFELTRVRIF
ncbi:hypothetical protein FRC01_002503, partial [Tulasnella sp. 417]